LYLIYSPKVVKKTYLAKLDYVLIIYGIKDEYYQQVDKDINQGISKFGNLTDGYWKLIRKLSIQYWLEWNRDNLFDIKFIN